MSEMTTRSLLAADLEAIYIGNLNTVDADLILPTEGANGSTLTWATGDARFIDTKGKVHRPLHGMGNRPVKLTVTALLNGESAQRIFEAMVIQESREEQIAWIRPVKAEVLPGQPVKLPSVVIVRCKDGRQVSAPVVWEEIPAERLAQLSVGDHLEVKGLVEGAEIPAMAEIAVVEQMTEADKPAKRLLEYIPASRVRLLDGTVFYDYQQRMIEYLLAQDDDQLLYSFRAACGLDTQGAEPMTGWDAAECKLRGHTTGHYMSGLALAWEATGDPRFLEKITYMVKGLKEVQRVFAESGRVKPGFFSAYDEEQFDLLEVYTKYPEIWAPYYTLDKIMSGLYDIYRATGMEEALQLEIDLGDWAHNRLTRLPQAQLDRMWSMYIAGEVGAMLGTMVKLYEITKDPKHLATARLFYNEKLYYPISENCDTLEDMHGNQHIPQAIGAAEMFRATDEGHYWQIGKNFWQIVTDHHTYVNGGVGETEMFHGPDTSCAYLSVKSEESCASYNMIRLTGEIFPYTLDPSMLDYYNNTLRNHIMASCSHTGDGGTTYFLPLNPGGQKTYSTTENTCCHGTGLESRFRYMGQIYAEDADYHYVNLLVDSKVETEDWSMSLRYKEDGHLCISTETGSKKGLKIHIPGWAEGRYALKVNGVVDNSPANALVGGFLTLAGPIPADTQIDIELPMELRILNNTSDEKLVNVAYGPTVLAALHEQESFLSAPKKLVRDGDGFTDGVVRMIPLNRVDLEKYHVYFKR